MRRAPTWPTLGFEYRGESISVGSRRSNLGLDRRPCEGCRHRLDMHGFGDDPRECVVCDRTTRRKCSKTALDLPEARGDDPADLAVRPAARKRVVGPGIARICVV
jgi:hypothetical protein